MKTLLMSMILTLTMTLAALARDAQPQPEIVNFQADDGQMLVGDLWKPDGTGPFPAVVWNHGSFKPGQGAEPKMVQRHEGLAKFYTEHGYIIFFPSRHRHVQSPGYTGKMLEQEQALNARGDHIALHEFWNLDVQSAIRYVRSRPDVDPHRLVVSGVSYGGIQTLLTAERGMGVRAAVIFSPGAESWNNARIRMRLQQSVEGARMPMFLLQAKNDYTLGPSQLLGPLITKKGPPNGFKIYPAFGTTVGDGHGGFAMNGAAIWGPDVLRFLDQVLSKKQSEPN